jgi:hypothetical protein
MTTKRYAITVGYTVPYRHNILLSCIVEANDEKEAQDKAMQKARQKNLADAYVFDWEEIAS